jgi:superfamily II DNA helicase RecQ
VIDTPAGREVVLKALSGVARAKGRFGKNVVAQMLKGSASEKMERWRLRELSTFGILAHFSQVELTRLLDADLSIKTGKLNGDFALEILVAELTGGKPPPPVKGKGKRNAPVR